MKKVKYQYNVKCRGCGQVKQIYSPLISKMSFLAWIDKHKSLPIQKQCLCDNSMMLFHDIISFGPILFI